ncbi:MAG: GNAT family N-acetyltransferase [Myxococcota bacterium]
MKSPRVTEAPALLRRARAEDASPLASLAAAALPEPWCEAGFRAQLARPEARVWLARAGAEPVGFLAAHRVLDELQILALAVAAPARRRGTGRGLLERALASEPDAREVHLEVRSNDAAAQVFYARQGFLPVGRRPAFYPDGVDAVLMRRTLPPGSG